MTIRKPLLALALAATATLAPLAAADSPAVAPAGLHDWLAKPFDHRPDLKDQPFADQKLAKQQSAAAQKLLWADWADHLKATRGKEWDAHEFSTNGKTLKWLQRMYGTKPKNGWNLYISLHGGGGAPAALNDSQWQNQIKLYQPANSIYIAPRAPTNNWDLWHESHIDPMFARLIQDAIVLGGVDPNHVYVMGYSAGGDGVYQLAPRMADHWAAAAMMAGHPNDASPEGLRNIGFTIHVGALDNGYDRNKVAGEWKGKLDALQKADPDGYAHEVQLHAGRGHWMNLEDAVAVDWMAKFTRNPIPQKVVWRQDDVTHDQFYWLALPEGEARQGQLVIASRDGQTIDIEKSEGVGKLTILLNDAMLDLDQPVTITAGGKQLFKGVVPRTAGQLEATLLERGDPDLIFAARVTVTTRK